MKQWSTIGLVIVIIIYVILATAFSQTLHFSRALDEGYHLDLVSFIKQTGRLPITYEERVRMARADLPPLYHILVALISSGVVIDDQPHFKYYGDSFRYQVIDHEQEHPFTIDTEDLSPPYFGLFLVWKIGRWFSIILGVATLILVFVTLQEIPLGRRPWTSLFGTALLAFIPRFTILGAAFNDDSLLALVAALYFWLLVRMIKAPKLWWPLLGLAAALGVSITIKYSLVLIPLELAIVLAVLARRYNFSWRWIMGRLIIAGIVALLCSSWWFGWNIWYFNTIATDGLLAGTIRALFSGGYNVTLNQIGSVLAGEQLATVSSADGASSGTFSSWIVKTFYSFWGYGINGQIPLGFPAFSGVIAMLLLAALGLWQLWHRLSDARQWILLAGLHTGLMLIVPLIRFETSGRIGQTAQGRHILVPAATAIIGLIIWGLTAVIPRRWHKPVYGVIIALFAGWTGLHLYQFSASATPLLPMRTLPQAAEWLSNPVNAQFDNKIELVSYDLNPQPKIGQLNINLGWRSLGYANENYLLKVLLLNEAGDTVSQWLGYNGNGRLPTLSWDPGDSVFDRLTLPLHNLPAGIYSVQVQLIGKNNQPLPVGRNDRLMLASFSLPQVAGAASDFSDIEIWGSNGPAPNNGPSFNGQFRYPGTISIITGSNATVELAAPDNSRWRPEMSNNSIHTFVIDPKWVSGEYQVQLDGNPAALSLFVENWWERYYSVPEEIETVLQANFANQLYLLGYTLPQYTVKAGESFPVTLYWQAPPEMSPQADFTQFNHLHDNAGTLRGGYDRRPLENYSTLLWDPGEVVMDGYAVPVEADAPPGKYYLDVGYYLTVGEASVNLPLVVDGEMADVSSVTIGPIEVVAP